MGANPRTRERFNINSNVKGKKGTVEMVNRLSKKEVLLKTLQFRYQLLQARIRELKEEKDVTSKTLTELKLKLANIRNEFCATATQFDEEYGFSSKNFLSLQCYNYDQNMYKKDIPVALSIPYSNVEAQELQRDLQDYDGIEALLFDVDFNSTQIN
ncbi:uncharacterized protein NPIL_348591 [Nephila pilipes]|uniref:Uncharacterized protein n=1 Tax=Nephila pilipes TaxID=299642 RepID=A0A8X6MNB7_NEPPI|nr:uncharacterized protein NPIL_348591 [Nephila pilipes]